MTDLRFSTNMWLYMYLENDIRVLLSTNRSNISSRVCQLANLIGFQSPSNVISATGNLSRVRCSIISPVKLFWYV